MKSILVIGAGGALAKSLLNALLLKWPNTKIFALDSRKKFSKVEDERIECLSAPYKRSVFEKIFQESSFDCVYHVGRLSRKQEGLSSSLQSRLMSNLIGTQEVLLLCEKYHVRNFVFLSTFHVYGALPDNALFMKESSMLRSAIRYPELRDVVEMDRIVSNWMWKNKEECKAVILRPCNVIGKDVANSISRYLKSKWAPRPMDFNPTFQFLSLEDLSLALVAAAEELPRGIYNVAPKETVSLHDAIDLVNPKKKSLPIVLLEPALRAFNRYSNALPAYLLEYLKYPVVLDSSKLTDALGKELTSSKDSLMSCL